MARQYLQRSVAGQKQQKTAASVVRSSQEQAEYLRVGDTTQSSTRPEMPMFRGVSHELAASSKSPLVVQAKLKVGEPDDRYEQEADAVAEQVVQQLRSPTPASKENNHNSTEAVPTLQTKPAISPVVPPQGGVGVSAEIAAAIGQTRGDGQPLETDLQRSLGQAIGSDFSAVRIHTDSRADQLNRSIGSRAFTTGQDVFFKQGLYRPHSSAGQKLIAHELTHVMQQQAGGVQHTPLIQADFEPAYVHSRTRLHDIEDGNPAMDKGVIANAKNLHVGDEIQAENDNSQYKTDAKGNTWMPAKLSSQSSRPDGYIRQRKIVFVSALSTASSSLGTPNAPREPVISGDLGGNFDPIVHAGDSDQIAADAASQSVASGVEGTLVSLLGLAEIAREIYKDRTAWEKLAKGDVFDLATAGVSASATLADSSAKVGGQEGGLRDAAITSSISEVTSELKGFLLSLKTPVLNLYGLWKLYRAQTSDKRKTAIVTFENLVSAAKSAAKVAKGVYTIVGKTAPMELFQTIPALSIAVSVINILIRGGETAEAFYSQKELAQKSNTLSSLLLKDLTGKPNNNKDTIFDTVSRGTGPTQQDYYRVKPDIRKGFENLLEILDITPSIQDKQKAAIDTWKAAEQRREEANNTAEQLAKKKREILDQKIKGVSLRARSKKTRSDAENLTGRAKETADQATKKTNTANTARDEAQQLAETAITTSAEAEPLQENIAAVHRSSGEASFALIKQSLQLNLEASEARKKAEALTASADQADSDSAKLSAEAEALRQQAQALEGEASKLNTKFVLTTLKLAVDKGKLNGLNTNAQDANTSANTAEDTAQKAKNEYLEACKSVIGAANSKSNPAFETYKEDILSKTEANNDLKNSFRIIDGVLNSLDQEINLNHILEPVRKVNHTIQKYEATDKLYEINYKRSRSGFVDCGLELTNIIGDFITLVAGVTGGGAIAGQTIKAVPAAYKLAKGGGGFMQKLYRDRGDTPGPKSSQTKHEEYVRHTKFLYGELAEAKTFEQAQALQRYIKATGVDINDWMQELENSPQKSVEMMVLAMKQR